MEDPKSNHPIHSTGGYNTQSDGIGGIFFYADNQRNPKNGMLKFRDSSQ
jgi:hypothetical protein